jgi:hypothetical protein
MLLAETVASLIVKSMAETGDGKNIINKVARKYFLITYNVLDLR